ncbi:MAG: formylglycine-generating enzyme family protein [Anaerolineae bacterium]
MVTWKASLVLLTLGLTACQIMPSVAGLSPTPFPASLLGSGPTLSASKGADRPPRCTTSGQRWVSPRDGVTLLCVPSGEFLMGAADNDLAATTDEKPQHRVYLDAFWIDETESTNAGFTRCVADGACHPRRYTPYVDGVSSATRLDYYVNPQYASYPVVLYDGDEAQAYCHWSGRRLPTEAEWEKAARGTDGRTFPWGEGIDCSRASYFECVKDTTPVDVPTSGASPYGALNMAGNVWEFVADGYDPAFYSTSSRNPLSPPTSAGYVIRGGGWHSLTQTLRTTARGFGGAEHYFDNQIGLRCALSDP